MCTSKMKPDMFRKIEATQIARNLNLHRHKNKNSRIMR